MYSDRLSECLLFSELVLVLEEQNSGFVLVLCILGLRLRIHHHVCLRGRAECSLKTPSMLTFSTEKENKLYGLLENPRTLNHSSQAR